MKRALVVLISCAAPGAPPAPAPGPAPARAIAPEPAPAPEPVSASEPDAAAPNSDANVDAVPPQPKHYSSVLHAGDSFTGAMGMALEKKFHADGSRYWRDVWVSVSIQTFARSSRFEDDIRARDPDLVLISLGANNVDDPEPDKLPEHIKSIVAKVGARDCWWIGPATWKKDTGAVDVIAKSCAPCRFYDSRGLKLPRRDGIHPSIEGGEIWADKFWEVLKGATP